MHDIPAPAPPSATAELQAKVERLTGATCVSCGRTLCGHQALFAIALGVADQPQCHLCLAQSLARSPEELRDQLWEHFRHRDCYGTIWNAATARESRRDDGFPECLWSTSDTRSTPTATVHETDPVAPADTSPHVEWNAGDLACGDLVLELRLKLRGLPPGAILHLVALDRGAREDIPAWCRMTGHRLLAAEHPHYRIERKPT